MGGLASCARAVAFYFEFNFAGHDEMYILVLKAVGRSGPANCPLCHANRVVMASAVGHE